MGSIARTWRELSGKSKWKGLLEPLNIDLRRYLLHYGQFAQATYDGFNFEKASKYAGNCRYSKKDFFSKVYLEKGNPFKYSVTKYLYATSKARDSAAFLLTSIFSKDAWSMESNWMGYVAVATDEGNVEKYGRAYKKEIEKNIGYFKLIEWEKLSISVGIHFIYDPS